MPERPIPAYPDRYTPADLDIRLDVRFTDRNGIEYRPPARDLVAGAAGTWTLRFENRHADLHAGAVITLVRFNYQIAANMPADDPRKRDHCSLETDSDASLELVTWRDAVNLLSIVVESGAFKKGETCTVRVGDRSGGGAGSEIFWSATDGAFLVAVDEKGDGAFKGVAGNPYKFRVAAHPEPDLLRLLGPSIAKTGEPFPLHLVAFDRNRNVIENFDGAVAFDIPDGIEGLPETHTSTAEDGGIAIFENVSAARHLPDLEAYLELEENPERFSSITPVALQDLSMGRCALFYCYWTDRKLPMSIRWFYEFDIPKIRYDLGWRDYGAFDENDLGPELMAEYR